MPYSTRHDYGPRLQQDWADAQAIAVAERNEGLNDTARLAKEIAEKIRQAHQDGRAAMNEGIREPVKWFAARMEKKLRLNDHKGGITGWTRCTQGYLIRRMRTELRELALEATAFRRLSRKKASDDADIQAAALLVINEAADVANFAMMLADQMRKRTKEPA